MFINLHRFVINLGTMVYHDKLKSDAFELEDTDLKTDNIN